MAFCPRESDMSLCFECECACVSRGCSLIACLTAVAWLDPSQTNPRHVWHLSTPHSPSGPWRVSPQSQSLTSSLCVSTTARLHTDINPEVGLGSCSGFRPAPRLDPLETLTHIHPKTVSYAVLGAAVLTRAGEGGIMESRVEGGGVGHSSSVISHGKAASKT